MFRGLGSLNMQFNSFMHVEGAGSAMSSNTCWQSSWLTSVPSRACTSAPLVTSSWTTWASSLVHAAIKQVNPCNANQSAHCNYCIAISTLDGVAKSHIWITSLQSVRLPWAWCLRFLGLICVSQACLHSSGSVAELAIVIADAFQFDLAKMDHYRSDLYSIYRTIME